MEVRGKSGMSELLAENTVQVTMAEIEQRHFSHPEFELTVPAGISSGK